MKNNLIQVGRNAYQSLEQLLPFQFKLLNHKSIHVSNTIIPFFTDYLAVVSIYKFLIYFIS